MQVISREQSHLLTLEDNLNHKRLKIVPLSLFEQSRSQKIQNTRQLARNYAPKRYAKIESNRPAGMLLLVEVQRWKNLIFCENCLSHSILCSIVLLLFSYEGVERTDKAAFLPCRITFIHRDAECNEINKIIYYHNRFPIYILSKYLQIQIFSYGEDGLCFIAKHYTYIKLKNPIT